MMKMAYRAVKLRLLDICRGIGYQGAAEDFTAVLATRASARGALVAAELEENQKNMSNCINAEKHFGGLSSSFTANVLEQYGWNEPLHDHIFKVSLSPTNRHIKNHPLCKFNGQHFAGVRNLLRSVFFMKAEKRQIFYEHTFVCNFGNGL